MIVGGSTPSRIASTEMIVSTPPAPPMRWPVIDLVDEIATVVAALLNVCLMARVSILSLSSVEVPWALM